MVILMDHCATSKVHFGRNVAPLYILQDSTDVDLDCIGQMVASESICLCQGNICQWIHSMNTAQPTCLNKHDSSIVSVHFRPH